MPGAINDRILGYSKLYSETGAFITNLIVIAYTSAISGAERYSFYMVKNGCLLLDTEHYHCKKTETLPNGIEYVYSFTNQEGFMRYIGVIRSKLTLVFE